MKKILFTYWHQGFDNAPPIVKACLKFASHRHKAWSIYPLDAATVTSRIDPVPIPTKRWQQLSLAHRSDLIRTQLLIKHGGVWADPTVWFCRPLDNWLPELMTAGLFLFQRPGRDRAISNWFIAAEPGNQLLIRLYESLCAYWSENDFLNFDRPMPPTSHLLHKLLSLNIETPRLWLKKPIIRLFRTFPYMIYHYAFYDLVRTDPECKAIWETMPVVSADGPHWLQRQGLQSPLTATARKSIERADSPVYKLSWKISADPAPNGSILSFLIDFAQKNPGSMKRN